MLQALPRHGGSPEAAAQTTKALSDRLQRAGLSAHEAELFVAHYEHALFDSEAIVVLARRLHSRVVAEGVETLADLRRVSSLGIDLVQGYLFARPLTARCVVQRLKELAPAHVN